MDQTTNNGVPTNGYGFQYGYGSGANYGQYGYGLPYQAQPQPQPQNYNSNEQWASGLNPNDPRWVEPWTQDVDGASNPNDKPLPATLTEDSSDESEHLSPTLEPKKTPAIVKRYDVTKQDLEAKYGHLGYAILSDGTKTE